MKIQIWSDIQCPFCYIGKRNLEAALEQFEHKEKVQIEWKSFQLDPSLPEHSLKDVNIYQYLADRKGISTEQSIGLHDNVTQMAKAAGLEYNFGKAVVANSFKAHRVIQLAKQKNLGEIAEERFFSAYFMEGADLSSITTLVQLGMETGLEEADVYEALNNPAYEQMVEQDIQQAANIGVRGVPFFLFDNKYAVTGAQPSDSILQALEKSFSEWSSNHVEYLSPESDDFCDVDGNC